MSLNLSHRENNRQDLLSKCWACSMRNWEPCSHCLSNSWSRLWALEPRDPELVLCNDNIPRRVTTICILDIFV